MSGSSVSGPKVATMECSGRTQRSAPGALEPAPQRIDFGHGKLRMTSGRISASTSMRGAARLLDQRDVEFALLGSGWILRLARSRRARRLSESPRSPPSGAPTRGPFFSSRTSGWRAGTPATCSASRRGVTKPWRPHRPGPRSTSASVTSLRRSSAACACMRAGISSEKSSSRRSGMGSRYLFLRSPSL